MWDRAYGNNLYVLFFCLFLKKWLKNYWHFVTGPGDKTVLIKWGYGITRVDLALERLTLSYNEMLRVENTGRDRKKVKKLLYYNSESIKNDFENKSMKKMIKLIFLMRQKLDVYLFQVCVGQQDIRR